MSGENIPPLEVEADGERHVLLPSASDRRLVISDLLRHAGLPLNTRCGGKGVCDGCRVDVVRGTVVHRHSGEHLTHAGGPPHSIRACEYNLNGTSARLRVPPRSSLKHQPQIVSDYQICIPAAHDPLYQEVELDATTSNLARAVEAILPGQPVRMRSETTEADGSVVLAVEVMPEHRRATQVQAKTPAALGIAVDIGTTTVAVMLVELKSGAVIARASRFNEQIHLGDDVVTRINLCMTDPSMLGQLQQAIAVKTMLPLIQDCLHTAKRPAADVKCIVAAGNTTMLHLLAGIDPSSMGVSPFTPAFLAHEVLAAEKVFGPSPLKSRTPCHLLPSAAAYIGSDLTAGILATGLLYDDGPSLLIDIGTNGEIILKHGGKLIGCATAAGPAFEGSKLSCGMRAVEGAISHVEMTRDAVAVQTIGYASDHAVGLCGSAYVDFLAQAHAAGILNDTGRFDAAAAPGLADRLMPWDDGHDVAFRVAWGRGRQPMVVTQRDVAALLQAKAAIAAGTLTLLDQCGLTPADIDTVYLAGGFGTHLDRASAIACGLLRGFTEKQIRAVGNTSLAGAYLALMDAGLLTEINRAAKGVDVVELNLDPSFESRFIDQLMLATT